MHVSLEKRSKPHLIKNGMRIDCKKKYYVPLVVPGISASSSSNRDSVSVKRDVETPVSERSGGTNEELR